MMNRIATVLLLMLSLSSFAQNSRQDLQIDSTSSLYELKLYVGEEFSIAEIRDKATSKLIQTIGFFQVKDTYYASRGFEIRDYNFDGYLDLAIDADPKSIPELTEIGKHILPSDFSYKDGDTHYWI
ncbi:MAG: hypothetical protein GY810_01760 [Aureispira sp.]|nr:hypothetical protein [Aureispira sp.]